MKKTFLHFVFCLLTNLAFAQKTILWSVKKPNSENTSYILGTFHHMGNSFVDEKPMIKTIIGESDIAVFESIENNDVAINIMLSREDDFSYREALNKEDVVFLENLSQNWKVPISKQSPAELLFKLGKEYITEKCGTIKQTDIYNDMDYYLEVLADQQNIKKYGLESLSDQLEAINNFHKDDFDWNKAKNYISNWTFNFQNNKYKDDICKLSKYYMKEKINYELDKACSENDPMLTKRNEKWMPQIVKLLEENNKVFIAVGLAHLCLDCGIISQLKEKGYEVKPVKLKKKSFS